MALGNQERIRQWVDALRSGEYEQTHSALKDVVRNDNGDPVMGFCCLGVASRLAAQDPESDVNETDNGFNGVDLMPPDEVRVWLGLPTGGTGAGMHLETATWSVEAPESIRKRADGGDDELPETVTLDALNDSYRFTFNQIADVIEKNFLSGKES